MKKMNKQTWLNWRKSGIACLLAGGLALFSLGNSYGQCTTITTLPWTEDFSNGSLPSSCWTSTNAGNSTSSNAYWKFSSSPGYGAQNNGKTSGTFAWVDASSPYSGIHDVTLITPSINVSSLTTPYLRFEWFKNNEYPASYDNNQLSVEVSSNGGTTWTSVFSDTSNDPNWRWEGISLASFANSTIKIKFVVDKDLNGNGYFYDDLLLDNITVMESPTCFAPVNLASSGITPTAATITWNTPYVTPGSGYLYYYNTTGIAPTASTSATASTTDTSVNLTTLSSSTKYYFWARSVCSTTDTSEWTTSPLIFRTPQIPATLPYTEDFTTTGNSWSLINDGQTNQWVVDNATGNTGKSMYISNDGGTSNAYTTSSASSVSQAYRDIVLTPGTTHPFSLAFDWKCAGEGTTYPYDYFRVWVVPTTYTPTAGTQITASSSNGVQLGGNFNEPSGGTTWHTEHYVIPNTYAGDTVRLVFEWRNDGGAGYQPPVAIDNVNVDIITCAIPTNLAANNVAPTSATIGWNALAVPPGNGYAYYYNTTGVAPTASTTATGIVTTNSANLNTLSQSTFYYFWVRSICSNTDTSDWSSVLAFRTPQIPATLPYHETYTSTGGNWALVNDNQTNQWVVDNATGNTGNSMYISNNGGTSNTYTDNASSTSQAYRDIALPSGPNPFDFTFDWKCAGEGTAYDYFRVWLVPNTYYPTAGSQITSYSSNGQQYGGNFNEPSGGTTWHTEHYVIPNTYAGDTVRLVFEWRNDGSVAHQPPVAIDNVNISVITCLKPDNLNADNITTTTADINWQVPAITPGSGYDYYYNTTGTGPSAGTTVSGSVTDTFANLTGLTQNTTYYVWVRSVCSRSDKSYWSDIPLVFTTRCDVTNVPYTVPMATANPPGLPDCMSEEALNPNDNEGWYASSGYPGSSYGFTGNYLESDYTGYRDGPVNNWVYTNKINMHAGTWYKLSFKYGNNSSYYTEKLAVAYGRAATADSMSAPIFDDTNIQLSGSTDTTVYFKIPVSDAYYIGFHAHSDEDEDYLFLSDIVVDSLPTCHVANSLIANNITSSSADLAWFGTALKYRIEYGESGFTLGTGTRVSTSSGNYHLTGLEPNTSYDFYVRDVCVPGIDSAGWSAAGTFKTLCTVPSVNVGHDTSYCEGGQVTLYSGNSDSSATVLWSTGSTNDSIIVNASGSYYAIVTNEFGCSAADTVFINVKPYPDVDLGRDTSICGNNTVVLDAGKQPLGTTFFWNTTATSQTITVADSGWYKVTADNVGCVTIDSVHVSKLDFPTVSGITGTSKNADCTFDFVVMKPKNVTDYYWDFGDGSNATGITPTHTYRNDGNYVVTLIASNECGADSVVTSVSCSNLGIGQLDLNNEQLKLYPNPAKDNITLQNESVYKMESIAVYNVLGQVIFKGKANSSDKYILNVQRYASGIYNVKITFKNGSWIQRKFEIRK